MPQAEICFTEEDLRKDYLEIRDCPIFSALYRADVPVITCGGDNFESPNEFNNYYSPELFEASEFIKETDPYFPNKWDDREIYFKKRFDKLLGKKFIVEWV